MLNDIIWFILLIPIVFWTTIIINYIAFKTMNNDIFIKNDDVKYIIFCIIFSFSVLFYLFL